MGSYLTRIGVTLLVVIPLFIGGCHDSPSSPEKEEKPTFPLQFSFINTSDPDPTAIDVRFAAHWPKRDSTTYVLTGAGDAGVNRLIEHTMERIGYPGCEMFMIFAVDKIWEDRDKDHPTYKWYIVDNRIVQDSSDAIIKIQWPADTARADVHHFDPDTVDESTPMGVSFGQDPHKSIEK